MKSRFHLINSGLYPETLPPCFVSNDAKRAFHGLVANLDGKKFHERKTEYVRYSGTKHDGSRRFFGTPNIVSYFHISSFIWKNWKKFEKNYELSNYSIGIPKRMDEGAERAVKVPSLSELSKHTSKNLRYAPFILKADIAQCFPSIYTHSIAWAAHGIEESKGDTNKDSTAIRFNALDFFVRNAQRGNTRGVLVGPDAYRLVAEFILSKIDHELDSAVGDTIVGAVRHVDDYYIGLRTEHDAQSVLSHLREVLATYELNLNDHKTKIYSSLEPINDLWAQRLRDHMPNRGPFNNTYDKIERAICEAIDAAKDSGSDSPIKILFRSFDEGRVYNSAHWEFVENNIQRIVQKHPHAIDYACLLVAKRVALGEPIDNEGWLSVAEIIVGRSLALNHHHEVLWMVWLLIVCGIDLPIPMIEELTKSRNAHIRALLVQAHVDGILKRKPKLGLGNSLSTMDANWLVNLVARAQGFSGAKFSGDFASEFDYLAKKEIKLIDFNQHIDSIKVQNKRAISRTRYGYDDEGDEDDFLNLPDIGF
ncbi:RNA-directed DNA polymerase [Cribrihabitans neustonicus]|uniref:RNA-directed DNA polymerase n=1 Tax=Cribrihabitans neustonicus TaxID=1429085 RepID=UPI003B5A8733